jgi:Zn-dependent peptidase ImmA (M78 family)
MSRIGDRIRESGKKLEWISKRSGLAVDRLRSLVDGAEATLAELRVLASALRIGLADFGEIEPGVQQVEMLFRGGFKKHQQEASTFSRQVSRVLDLVRSQESALEWLNAFGGNHDSYEDAERNAALFRKLFFDGDNVSPLADLPQLTTEVLGLLLLVVPGEKMDGASALTQGHGFVFLSPRTFKPRMLATLAHELGHFVAHHNPLADFAVFDPFEKVGHYHKNRREQYCDAFASCLLLPPAGIGVTLKAIREKLHSNSDVLGDVELLLLAQTYGVSFYFAAKRCEDLGLLPNGGAISIYDELVAKHESPEKRAAELGFDWRPEVTFPIVPARVLDAAVERVRSGDLSIGRVAMMLNSTIGDIFRANRPNDDHHH